MIDRDLKGHQQPAGKKPWFSGIARSQWLLMKSFTCCGLSTTNSIARKRKGGGRRKTTKCRRGGSLHCPLKRQSDHACCSFKFLHSLPSQSLILGNCWGFSPGHLGGKTGEVKIQQSTHTHTHTPATDPTVTRHPSVLQLGLAVYVSSFAGMFFFPHGELVIYKCQHGSGLSLKVKSALMGVPLI